MHSEDQRTIRDCLRAAVDGPFFPDWEFQTLIGLERDDVAAVVAEWPESSRPDNQALAVNNVLTNLLSYAHGTSRETWHRFIGAAPREVAEVLARWRGEEGQNPSAENYFKRLM